MSWANFHSHSVFCDGKDEPEEFIKSAVNKGFIAYGFSSHAPVPFISKWNMPYDKLNGYLMEISRLKSKYYSQIEIYSGLEIDYLEEFNSEQTIFFEHSKLDYSIGSLHYLARLNDGTPFCIDGLSNGFFQGIKEIFDNNFRKAITLYYEYSIKLVQLHKPNIIGHMDKIKMHNNIKEYFKEEEQWYINLINEYLNIIKQNNCIIEVNTRGLYKNSSAILYPSLWILKLIYNKKIPIILNSDSHSPHEIDQEYENTAKLLEDIGFRTMRILFKEKWQDIKFTKKGLIV